MIAEELYKFILKNRDNKELCLETINAEFLREQLAGIHATEQAKTIMIDRDYPLKRINRNELSGNP